LPSLFVSQDTKGLISVFDVEEGGLSPAVFLQRALERAFRFRTSGTWATDVRTLDTLAEALDASIVLADCRDDYESLVLEVPDAILYAWVRSNEETKAAFNIDVLSTTRQAGRHLVDRAREIVPTPNELEPGRIPVTFWYSNCGNANRVRRSLDAPAWSDARVNYAARTRAALEPLIREPRDVIARGRLLLFHGQPGTGKTSALRTLARENRGKISLEYVLDPEAMFGREAGYFMEVVFYEDDDNGATRVLVLEDCDELLSADAKDRSGQGLARLLNLVDGFIGQGLDLAVLITTNEPLSVFHPAVSRPGRCGAAIEFEPFTSDEAASWLAARGRVERAAGRMTLAELIGAPGDESLKPGVRERIGFVTKWE
jgi:hypothetical protein